MSNGSYQFFDLKPAMGSMRAEVIAGLQQSSKQISPKYFYNESGSELFEDITRLPEYYLTRTEIALFDAHSAEIAEHLGLTESAVDGRLHRARQRLRRELIQRNVVEVNS